MDNAPSLLLVDDNSEFLEVLERRFRRRGFAVTACTNEEAALAAARAGRLDAALIDRNLRATDGIELLKRLKQEQPEMAVIVLSGSSDAGAAHFALDSGAAEFLAKPCGLTELEAAVRRAISDRDGAAESVLPVALSPPV